MLITTACEQCSTTFEAASFAARYCSRRCQQQAYRARKKAEAEQAEASQESVTVETPPASPWGLVATATLDELRVIHREGSAAGLAALALAQRIDDNSEDSAGGLAALVRAHAFALDRALMVPSSQLPATDDDDEGEDDDPVINLQNRRDRKRRKMAER